MYGNFVLQCILMFSRNSLCRQTLSIRLSNTLISHRRHTADCLLPVNQSEMVMDQPLERPTLASLPAPVLPDNPAVPAFTQNVSLTQPVESSVIINPSALENETGTGVPFRTQHMGQEELAEGEAVESLCARLAAIELLIQQAESTEARLREEFDLCFRQTTDSRLNLPMSPNARLSSSIPVLVSMHGTASDEPIFMLSDSFQPYSLHHVYDLTFCNSKPVIRTTLIYHCPYYLLTHPNLSTFSC